MFCEEKGVITDYQFGFRKDRACRDALLVMLEMVENRGGEKVYAGFMDVTKAYPSI